MFDFLKPKVPTVSVDDLMQAITANEDILILDVRTPGEYAKAHIANSINLPVDEVEEKVSRVAPDKSKKTFVHCMSGSRSIVSVDMMVKMGYTNVFDVTSGLLAWRIKKYPLI